jgi:XapX domain-containing protein
MKIYLVALGVGLLVGVIYALLNVRSPAPPVVALIGLLGMLLGEQAVPVAKRLMSGQAVTVGWFHEQCTSKITGVVSETTVKTAHADGLRSSVTDSTSADPRSDK